MANYLNKEILCEAYTHLESNLFKDKAGLAELRSQLLPFFTERAKFLLGEDIEIKIEFEDGSLKTKLTVLGSAGTILMALANGISGYGGFRESVTQLSSDATTLAQSATLEILFRTKTAYCDRVRIEKRKGVFGRVSDLLGQLDGIHADLSINKLPANAKALGQLDKNLTSLLEWNNKANILFDKLDSDVTRGCVSAGLAEELVKLPDEPLWAEQLQSHSFRSEIVKSDPEHAGNLAGAAERFRVTVKLIRKQMMDRVKIYAPEKA